ncbi:expressed unknown protein [Seminavis robusta]|uniref:Serine aminopeptidase S33 domain-containing protein n=1 Tax=Seminavis robusta TaxID=568900 RepID=A0A9N8HA34_9STRA|nr:expressed unknown protein [Seminavis robusta]|eukprot:Sro303_g112410.1 n/a (407) ;mRNA; f:36506-37726
MSSVRVGRICVCQAFVTSKAAPRFLISKSTKLISSRRFSTITVHEEKPLDDHESSTDNRKQSSQIGLSLLDTKLGQTKEGVDLLDGLDVYSVPALQDHHPLAVYGLDSTNPTSNNTTKRYPILLLHGRTWSSVPVYHLLGGNNNVSQFLNKSEENDDHDETVHESRSFMEALLEKGLQPYALDFRGFGGTPADDTGYVEPHRCVQDVQTVLQWMAKRHNTNTNTNTNVEMPALLGWSQGALVAQLVAQFHPTSVSKLILYGSIYDPLVRYPREPLYQVNLPNTSQITNTFNDAIEDFTVQGSIPPAPAALFAQAALVSDPVKAVWKHSYQFNNCDPARVHTPCLVVAGDQDPYAPLHVQQDLFCNLGRGSDRTWSILAGADHAAHLLNDVRQRFVNVAVSFVQNGK